MLVAFFKNIIISTSKKGASPVFRQVSRESPIRFLKFTSKFLHNRTVSQKIFAMTTSSRAKFGLK